MKILFLLILFINFNNTFAQEIDYGFQNFESYTFKAPLKNNSNNNNKVKNFVFPVTCVGYGILALHNHSLQSLNNNLRRNIKPGTPYYSTTIDNYLQYLPAFTVYGLNASGLKGRNNFKDRTFIFGMSSIFTCALISPLKTISDIERPDHSANNSFPSGHTATAFAGAEFLRQEYKGVSKLYGIGGYIIATTTGLLRMYNNRHWLSDIIAGAGIGILSTKIAYLIYPFIQKTLFKSVAPPTNVLSAEDINNIHVAYFAN